MSIDLVPSGENKPTSVKDSPLTIVSAFAGLGTTVLAVIAFILQNGYVMSGLIVVAITCFAYAAFTYFRHTKPSLPDVGLSVGISGQPTVKELTGVRSGLGIKLISWADPTPVNTAYRTVVPCLERDPLNPEHEIRAVILRFQALESNDCDIHVKSNIRIKEYQCDKVLFNHVGVWYSVPNSKITLMPGEYADVVAILSFWGKFYYCEADYLKLKFPLTRMCLSNNVTAEITVFGKGDNGEKVQEVINFDIKGDSQFWQVFGH